MNLTRLNIKYEHVPIGKLLDDPLFPYLIEAHADEVELTGGKLDPYYEAYVQLDEQGVTRTFTAHEENFLFGYSVWWTMPDLHRRGYRKAQQDLIYMAPHYRWHAPAFFKFMHSYLEPMVHELITSPTVHKDFSPLLKRAGYTKGGEIYCKKV